MRSNLVYWIWGILMRWIAIATLCTVVGIWAIENYIDEYQYKKICKDARKERIRKMHLGGQVLDEGEFD